MSVLLRREGGLMAIIQSLGCFCFSLLLLLLLWTVTSLCVVLTSTAAVVEMVTKHRVEFDSVRWRYCPCTEWSELRVWQCSVVWWCVQLLSIIEGTVSECWCCDALCDGACSCCQSTASSVTVMNISGDIHRVFFVAQFTSNCSLSPANRKLFHRSDTHIGLVTVFEW